MKRLPATLKAMMIFCALCAPSAVLAAPQWDYVYNPTTLPEDYPDGAWNGEVAGQPPELVGGRLHFNILDGEYFFYWRDAVTDPRIAASTFTFEWRHELVNGGSYEMGYGLADREILLRFDGYGPGDEYLAFGEFNDGETHVEIPVSLGKGLHTYRFVKREDRSELYVDGILKATYEVPPFVLDYVELDGFGWYAPYEGYWDHVAYTRGAYTPAQLPSPGEEPPAGDNTITRHNYTGPLLVTVNATSEPLVSYVTDAEGEPAPNRNVSFSISRYPVGATGQQLDKLSGLTDAAGLVDVNLRLGNIPAEYDVKAECQSCVPESNEVTFTCCGKVANDHFSQSRVPAWSTHTYARHAQSEQYGTIGYLGCGLASLATLINYYSASIYPGIPRTNPLDLNTYLLELPGDRGYTANNDVNFTAIGRYTSGRVSFVDRYDVGPSNSEEALLDTADGLIRSGIPLIFRVSGHFLLVTGKCGDKFIVSDPAGGLERLYDPDSQTEREFEGLRVFNVW